MPWTACSPGLSSGSRPALTRPATSTGSFPDRLHHRPRPPARCGHRPKRGRHRQDEPDDHALGRSRGGLTSKIHLACDGRGRPLAILLTPGERHDDVCARLLLERIRVPRTGLGRPHCRPDQVVADKAYSSRGFRSYLRNRGIACTIPEKNDQQQHRRNRGRRGGRPPAFDRQIYRRRNVVERCFNRLKVSAASPPGTTRPPPRTRQRSVSRHSCSGQDRFEDGPWAPAMLLVHGGEAVATCSAWRSG
ncbi:IS5 family transposase [Streptomyces sp.]|uniref:IS5 family transposase n=1 Tax=Streptomyces sp. TaxID=1931 RepID=UPI0035C6E0C3